MPRVPGDVVVLPEGRGRWAVMNVFSRTCLGVDASSLRVLEATSLHDEGEVEASFGGAEFPVWEIERFSSYDGLFADPTPYIRSPDAWPEAERLGIAALLARLRKHWLLIDDERAYAERFGDKTSLLDAKHFGNFHQQLGKEVMLKRRESPDDWWLRQKFTGDLRGVRDNLYKAVQEHYLRAYFGKRFKPGQQVIDVGCGTGFYSGLMAAAGPDVLGVDPNARFVEIAARHGPANARFAVMPVGTPDAMKEIPPASADFVFMSDTLLFYFVPNAPSQVADIEVLFKDIKRILKPGGTFISVEPHHTFWLAPWLGDEGRPFTVLTEHMRRTFAVTPSMSCFVQACTRVGLAITWMDEMRPDPSFESVDPRAYRFAAQFPLWQLFEMRYL